MARFKGPKKKLMRRFDQLRDTKSKVPWRRHKSAYGLRLEEKQKLKFIYGLAEKSLRHYIDEAKKGGELTPVFLLQTLETRLDNVIYRLGFTKTRAQARQLVNHNHILINGRKVNIPSFRVKTGQKISLTKKIYKSLIVQEALAESKNKKLPLWLKRENNEAEVVSLPPEEELRKDVDMAKVLEFYS
ncbi:MAG: hypothetical protein ACD_12C00223G0004 [uncultured bacterium]|nr:MAG: hypothetical protein ACD_12C00223G0004 [uncultured bacterium]